MANILTRDQIWSQLNQEWDVIIIGGGITGAGILREAVRMGYSTLLLEAHDFASGTSSRSSKLVHGGFRYLKNGQVRLTYESVRERERLLHEGRGLVTKTGFLLANYQGDAIPGWVFGAGLVFYDLLAFQWGHRRYDPYDMHDLCPYLCEDGLQGGFRYFDAQTDDARLVLRLIQEAVNAGGTALNYARVVRLLINQAGNLCGVAVEDRSPEGQERSLEVRARVVVNASGAWADDLRSQVGGKVRLRKLRGSHLVFPSHRLALTRSISFLHPRDGRPVFAVPWEGVTLVGTTDVDQATPMCTDPAMSVAEFNYLLEAAQRAFTCLDLTPGDVQATFAGIRPVINTGKDDPSKESREHILWQENGLLTIAGGKLTTFRLIAKDVLRKLRTRLPNSARNISTNQAVLDPLSAELTWGNSDLSPAVRVRLAGRHGQQTSSILADTPPNELSPLGSTPALRAELRWAARSESVVHLDDLLLRRVRLGLLLPNGAIDLLEQKIRPMAQPELGWSDLRWEAEAAAYADLWKRCYDKPVS